MQIYNTLTKKKEEFKPNNPPIVTFYMCGPTVYDYFHIGNGRSFVMADIIRRYLIYKGYDVKFIMNLTDIDDRIINQSIKEKIPSSKVSDKYTKAFFEDIEKLKITEATEYPKATKHVDDIINFIKKLEDKGFAYNVDGNVFYDVSKYDEYGKLSGKNPEDLISGARVEINEEKKNAIDFALWKKAKPGEPCWESPWGSGRPGWHIECSVMSMKHLGETIDIHAGGNDLIFPHHENEIAQSEAITSKPFVKYWMHFGFLNINDEKMSKSLGNFFTVRDILKKYSAETIKLLFNQTHYGRPIEFSDAILDAAEHGSEKIKNFVSIIENSIRENNIKTQIPDFDIQEYYDRFESVMDDDFNTPQATAVVFDFIRDVNKIISENENLNSEFCYKVKEFLKKTADKVLGIVDFRQGKDARKDSLENELIQLLIDLRIHAKEEKNFVLADKIRDKLSGLGIILQDGKKGTGYKRK